MVLALVQLFLVVSCCVCISCRFKHTGTTLMFISDRARTRFVLLLSNFNSGAPLLSLNIFPLFSQDTFLAELWLLETSESKKMYEPCSALKAFSSCKIPDDMDVLLEAQTLPNRASGGHQNLCIYNFELAQST